jgi:mRNA interferase MazF
VSRGQDPRPGRGDVFLVALDPAQGREIPKTRPCVVVSPDELNRALSTVTVAPMTTGGHAYPFRVPCRFRKRTGFVVLDQLRTVDAERLVRRQGRLPAPALRRCLASLREMFEE